MVALREAPGSSYLAKPKGWPNYLVEGGSAASCPLASLWLAEQCGEGAVLLVLFDKVVEVRLAQLPLLMHLAPQCAGILQVEAEILPDVGGRAVLALQLLHAVRLLVQAKHSGGVGQLVVQPAPTDHVGDLVAGDLVHPAHELLDVIQHRPLAHVACQPQRGAGLRDASCAGEHADDAAAADRPEVQLVGASNGNELGEDHDGEDVEQR
mmetsp:Transcript_66383/g.191634  ORF Transcript_66383/g.191634 Transcript_66383/m.191634 type:complete len:209 (+) Transcript_66383:90-716(+)